MTKDDVIRRIGILRSRAKLSARELSLRIGKNSAYISRLEAKEGSFEPSVSALLAIIEACGSTPSEFFYYDINEYQNDLDLLILFKATSEEKKKSIKYLLQS